MLCKMLGSKRHEVRGSWRELYSQELHDRQCSLNVIRVSKSRKVGYVGHVAGTWEMRNANKLFV